MAYYLAMEQAVSQPQGGEFSVIGKGLIHSEAGLSDYPLTNLALQKIKTYVMSLPTPRFYFFTHSAELELC